MPGAPILCRLIGDPTIGQLERRDTDRLLLEIDTPRGHREVVAKEIALASGEVVNNLLAPALDKLSDS
jgi:hypothetical protein